MARYVATMSVNAMTMLLLAGCATASLGPTVQVYPGKDKSATAFEADAFTCRSNAKQSAAGPSQPQQAATGATSGTSGTDPSAWNIGGLLGGTSASATTQAALQQHYNEAYAGCMMALGNTVPGADSSPAADSGSDRSFVRAVQTELIRVGALNDSADGMVGPKTRNAIVSYEQASALPVDGQPSSALLASLRRHPSAATAASTPVASTAAAGTPAAGTAASTWVVPAASGTPSQQATGSAADTPGAQPWAIPVAAPVAPVNATSGNTPSGNTTSQWTVPVAAPGSVSAASP